MHIFPFDMPVVVDLDSIDLSTQELPALYDHCADVDFVVGQIHSVQLESGQLIASGIFTLTEAPPDRNYARKVLDRADAGYRWQASIGGNPSTLDEVAAGETVTVNGRAYQGPCLIARGVTLREISFVVLGGDRRTSAVVARNAMEGASMPFEEWLLSLGFDDPASLTEIQRANLSQKYKQEYPDEAAPATAEDATPPEEEVTAEGDAPPPEEEEEEETPMPTAAARRPAIQARRKPVDVTAESRRAAAAEIRRQARITELCASHGNPNFTTNAGKPNAQTQPIAAAAIEGNWSIERTELELLRACRTTTGTVVAHGQDDLTLEAMQCALILRSRGRLDHASYASHPGALALNLPAFLRASVNADGRQRAMEAAHRFDDLSAVDMCRHALRLEGRPYHGSRRDVIRAAFSGGSLTNIFTTNVNAILLATFDEAPDTTEAWIFNVADVADFKTQERPRLVKGGALKKLPRGGTADHLSRSDQVESYKIARYAGQIIVDEQDVIDDSLGALADMPVEMGNAAGRLRPDLVYAIILDNPTLNATGRALFNTTDGNKASSGAALSSTTLRTAVQKHLLYQENGVNLNMPPTHLLVGPSNRHLAYELTNSSQILIAGTAGSVTERGSNNALLADGLVPVVDARLENGVTDPSDDTASSGSSTAFLTVNSKIHNIEVAFLRGTGRAPQTRSFVLEKGQYGMGWDVALDIGAAPMEWRAFWYNAGA